MLGYIINGEIDKRTRKVVSTLVLRSFSSIAAIFILGGVYAVIIAMQGVSAGITEEGIKEALRIAEPSIVILGMLCDIVYMTLVYASIIYMIIRLCIDIRVKIKKEEEEEKINIERVLLIIFSIFVIIFGVPNIFLHILELCSNLII